MTSAMLPPNGQQSWVTSLQTWKNLKLAALQQRNTLQKAPDRCQGSRNCQFFIQTRHTDEYCNKHLLPLFIRAEVKKLNNQPFDGHLIKRKIICNPATKGGWLECCSMHDTNTVKEDKIHLLHRTEVALLSLTQRPRV